MARGRADVDPAPTDAGLPARCGWFVALGVALLVLRLIAFGNLFIATMVSVLHVGVLMFIGAVAQVVHAFQVKRWGALFFWPLSGVLYGLTAAATAISSACWSASTAPTTPVASASWTAARPRRSSASGSRGTRPSPTRATARYPIPASCPSPARHRGRE